MRSLHSRAALGAAVVGVLALATACGSSGGGGGQTASKPNGPVTLTWWHNATTEPLKTVWQQTADAYHKRQPKVSFKIDPIQNEQFTTKIPVALQSGSPPDLYQQWGGGQEADQIRSGKVMDITDQTKGWIGELGKAANGWKVNGRQYGIPYDQHVVGFWYRKDLFNKAGITTPPTTMAELNADVAKLKQAGVVPIAIGSKDRWPDAFWWEYFTVRRCPIAVLQKAIKSQNLGDPCFMKAGQDMKAFLATKPFQPGFLGTPAQQGAGSSAGMLANGKAAMELQGDWEGLVTEGLTSDKQIASKLGWFPFPQVPGGQGAPGVALGGGDGFSCTTQATTACIAFLKYLASTPVQKKLVTKGAVGLPSNPSAASAIKDPTVKKALDYSVKAPYIQTYFDVALPTSQGQALNDAIANFFAGQGGPEAIPQSVSQ
jgi:raffinose/stachyose/melibiose transport system substrate-binding protein